MKIKILFLTLLLVCSDLSGQSFDRVPDSSFNIKELSSESSFKIGLSEENNSFKYESIFLNQKFDNIISFFQELPIKNSNFAIQTIINDILTSDFNIDNLNLSNEEDQKLFEIRINKLFEIADFNSIDKIYTKTSSDFSNENINLKRLEGFFLRNEYRNACQLLNNDDFKKSSTFGKFEIICNIFNQDFEKARFNLSLLKENNEPGDNLFIELCYNIMGDINLSKSKLVSEKLENISSLNPILLSSLQIAEISPNFEHIRNAPTSFLTFILSSPSSSIDIKLYTAEILVRQNRIQNSMLAEIYQLITFNPEEVKDALRLYKSLSPVRARSLLYQALISENNQEVKYQIIKALLKHSKNDKLFYNISYLVKNSVNFFEIDGLLNDDISLISEVYSCVENYDMAFAFLAKQYESNQQNIDDYELKLILIKLKEYITNRENFNIFDFENLIDQILLEKKVSKEVENLILISNLLFKFSESLNNKILSINQFIDKKRLDGNPIDFYMGIKASEDKSYFNSLKIIFKILNNKEIFDLNDLEVFLILKILLDLDLQEAFKSLSTEFLLYRT